MPTQTRYRAEYLYPGSFFPEETYRDLKEPTFENAVKFGPNEDGYFKKDGWYAVIIREKIERLMVDPDKPASTTWDMVSNEKVKSFIVGRMIHMDSPEMSGSDKDILRSNIRSNSRDPLKGYGVLTRCGNWQIASDWAKPRFERRRAS